MDQYNSKSASVDSHLAVMQMSNQRHIPDEVGIVHNVRQIPAAQATTL